MASKTKRLPKGLAEFEASLHDLKYAIRLLPRLLELPESNLAEAMNAFVAQLAMVEAAERDAAEAREKARKIAQRMWQAAKSNWSVKELQAATGYDDK